MADFNLPNEIWCMIFSYLPFEPKKNATATCKLWSRLIREDPNLSGHILVSWYNMGSALETLQWNWSNWPALKTLELNKFKLVDSREAIQNIIKTLSLRKCPPNIEEVLFNVDLTQIQTNGPSLLKYQPSTDQIFGLGQELNSIQKWNEYESNMKALKKIQEMDVCLFSAVDEMEYMRHMAGVKRPGGTFDTMLAKLEATPDPSNDLLLLIQKIRRLWEQPVDGYFMDSDLVQYMELDEFLDECDDLR